MQADKAAEILKLPHEQRSPAQQQSLIQLMQQQTFFIERKMKDKDILEICYGLQYLQSPPGKIECRFGDVGDKFYIILRGKCSVWLPIPNDKMRDPVFAMQKTVSEAEKVGLQDISELKFMIRDENEQVLNLQMLCEKY